MGRASDEEEGDDDGGEEDCTVALSNRRGTSHDYSQNMKIKTRTVFSVIPPSSPGTVASDAELDDVGVVGEEGSGSDAAVAAAAAAAATIAGP